MNKRCPVVRTARFSLFLVILFLAPFLKGQDAATPWRLAEAEQVLLQNSCQCTRTDIGHTAGRPGYDIGDGPAREGGGIVGRHVTLPTNQQYNK